jgi:hypothetical protein
MTEHTANLALQPVRPMGEAALKAAGWKVGQHALAPIKPRQASQAQPQRSFIARLFGL